MDTIDYYLSLNSPWSYLGHRRLMDLGARHDVAVRIHPVDFVGTIFPVSGGLPVGKRAPQRQAYRLAELKRWRAHLGIELNLQPEHWPADEQLASRMVLAERDTGSAAMALAGAVMGAVWAENRDIGDTDTLLAIASQCGLDGSALLEAAGRPEMAGVRDSECREAIERGVFGAPTYIFRDELFWGQDRLDFLERAVAESRAAASE